MSTRPFLAFACAHMTDERLYAHQIEALSATHDCKVFVFREQSSMGAMAEHLLAHTPERFTLIGLSLGGYMAFEVIRQALHRLERLVLIDTTAVADHPARRDGRLRDIAAVQKGGIEALIPELPSRWLLPAHTSDAALVALMGSMAHSVGALGQYHQQTAMLGRPDSHKDLERVKVPTLLICGRQDPVTPVSDHEAMAACVPGSRLIVIEDCGHLSTLEQPTAVTQALCQWLDCSLSNS
ncbi:alpha/beta fold hydrolase [Hydrogenophaga pseudoflava]|uniref:3-oxoadipate enol-lactonase 2 n=1 Tax=Hydrogenophaga pseudoflava TaxID=47421 RepID=A0A4P6X3J0_HYDPS|nr:alpha/beta fold hydrolase [Hydrogenophaga pseudoflava]QBM29186.1 3-oxoadipate enol-lactonase 2 [Hydrogenophaga pseudoflava]